MLASRSSRWETTWYGPPRTGPIELALFALSLVFGAAVRVRQALYALRWLRPINVAGPRIVSVGNLTVGGAGKTPVVIFLAQWALRAGHRVAVLSRGYGRTSSAERCFDAQTLPPAHEVGDEPRLIAARCPGAQVYVGADRVALARRAAASGATFVLLDDAYQHRRLERDVDVVVFDGLGNGRLLPRGPLREPASALARATIVWQRGEEVPPVPADRLVQARHLLPDDPALRGAKVLALAGLARPSRFIDSLRRLGANVVAERLYPDHHRFAPAELAEAQAAAAAAGARIVTTEKDAQRLPTGFDAHVVKLHVEVLSGLELLAQALGLPSSLVAPSGL